MGGDNMFKKGIRGSPFQKKGSPRIGSKEVLITYIHLGNWLSYTRWCFRYVFVCSSL